RRPPDPKRRCGVQRSSLDSELECLAGMDLRPLTLGEVVDRSASLWRAHWKALFQLYLGFQLGEFVLLKAWEVITVRYFPIARGGQRMIEAFQSEPAEAVRQLAASMGGLAV